MNILESEKPKSNQIYLLQYYETFNLAKNRTWQELLNKAFFNIKVREKTDKRFETLQSHLGDVLIVFKDFLEFGVI